MISIQSPAMNSSKQCLWLFLSSTNSGSSIRQPALWVRFEKISGFINAFGQMREISRQLPSLMTVSPYFAALDHASISEDSHNSTEIYTIFLRLEVHKEN